MLFQAFGDINYIAVLVAIIANMLVGSFWYSGLLFGNMWMQLRGYKKEELKGTTPTLAVSAVFGAVQAIILAVFLILLGDNFLNGILVTFLIWLGFVATNEGLEMLYGGKKFQLFLLDSLHRLASFLAMGIILILWT